MRRIVGVMLLTLMLISVLTSCGFEVPKPAIKSAEFDFTVTYEIDGVEGTVSGVYVCEYKGLGWALDGGYYREWEGYVKDNTVEEVISLCKVGEYDTLELCLGFYPDYMMGDPDLYWDIKCEPYLCVRHLDDEGLGFNSDATDILEMYNARIISYDYGEPIENSFSPGIS